MSTANPTSRLATPEDIRVLVAFLNTEDFRTGNDALKAPGDLGDWLRRHGLLEGDTTLTGADLRRALDVRDGLRALVVAHLGGTRDTHALRRLDEAARDARPRLLFRADGADGFASEDFDEALGHLLEILVRSRREGLWNRLRLCRDEACRTVFYDSSRSANSKWCTRRCGSRVRSRIYRRSETYRRRPHRSVPRLPRMFRADD